MSSSRRLAQSPTHRPLPPISRCNSPGNNLDPIQLDPNSDADEWEYNDTDLDHLAAVAGGSQRTSAPYPTGCNGDGVGVRGFAMSATQHWQPTVYYSMVPIQYVNYHHYVVHEPKRLQRRAIDKGRRNKWDAKMAEICRQYRKDRLKEEKMKELKLKKPQRPL
jgi:hypothetical protein